MTLTFHWLLPSKGGDGRQALAGGHGVASGPMGRPASHAYLGQIARRAEQLGFEAALTPAGARCEDAWVSTTMLASVSKRLKFLVALRPGLTSPTLAAQMAPTSLCKVWPTAQGGAEDDVRLALPFVLDQEAQDHVEYSAGFLSEIDAIPDVTLPDGAAYPEPAENVHAECDDAQWSSTVQAGKR